MPDPNPVRPVRPAPPVPATPLPELPPALRAVAPTAPATVPAALRAVVPTASAAAAPVRAVPPSTPPPGLRDAIARSDWPRVRRLVESAWPTLVREHPEAVREALETLIARASAPAGAAGATGAAGAAPSAAAAGASAAQSAAARAAAAEAEAARAAAAAAARRALSPRERVVLAELASGDSVADIAARLFVSPNTVKSQLRTAYRKLGVTTRAAAERAAADLGLLI